MNTNSGTMAGATSYVAERTDEKKKTFKTLPFEIAVTVSCIAICVVLLIMWNKIPTNFTDVESAYIGPESEQILGVKVVRDYDRNSPYYWIKTKDSVGNPHVGLAMRGWYLSIKDPAARTMPENILVDFPGVHVGMMTHALKPCNQVLFKDSVCPTGYTTAGHIDFNQTKEHLSQYLDKNNGVVQPENVGLATKLLVRTKPSHVFAKRSDSSNRGGNPYRHISGRRDLGTCHESLMLIKYRGTNISVTNMSRADTSYVLKERRIVPVYDSTVYIGVTLESKIKDEPLLSLFGYNPVRETAPKITKETLARLYFTEQQRKEINFMEGLSERVRSTADKTQKLSDRAQSLVNKSNNRPSTESLAQKHDTAGLIQSLVSLIGDRDSLETLKKETEALLNEFLSLTNMDKQEEKLGEYINGIVSKNANSAGLISYGKGSSIECPDKAFESRMFSAVGCTHQFSGYTYSTSDFGKPHKIITMNDLSRTNEIIRICPNETDNKNKPSLMKLEYDFRTPIDNIACSIEPDETTGTGIIYTDPGKLADIVTDGLHISVHFPEWDNTQTKRFFILTLAITIMVSYLLRRIFTHWIVEKRLAPRVENPELDIREKGMRFVWISSIVISLMATIVCLILYFA